MELWEIILYSFTQGVTEFLPISSSAHLFILEHLLFDESKEKFLKNKKESLDISIKKEYICQL